MEGHISNVVAKQNPQGSSLELKEGFRWAGVL
jgi:hypothetical protein